MKIKFTNFSINPLIQFLTILSITFLGVQRTNAQYTATWALTTDRSSAVTGTQAANVIASNMVEGAAFVTNGGFSTNGFQCKITSGNWPTVATNGHHIDIPLSPNTGWDLNITGLTFTGRTSGASGNNMASLAYQTDGAGAFTAFGTPQVIPSGGTNAISFGTLSQMLPTGHTYIIRIYAYAVGTTSSSRNLYFKDVAFTGTTTPPGVAPTVLTNSASATGMNTGTAQGQITNTSLTAISQSGICWSTSANPTVALSTKTTNGPLTVGTFNHAITGLTAGTLYHVRAYATNAVGTGYGTDLTFTTLPPTTPTLTTNTVTNITIFTALSGGNINDDGGASISAKGVCWSTTANPTIANSITNSGTGIAAYTSTLNGLLPSTTYFVRAFATNSVGTAYGNQQTFTTPPPTPTLTVNPTLLSFGSVLQNTISAVQSYSLQGFYLNAGPGNITVNAPAGFRVSMSNTTGFAPSISVPYTGTSLAATPIYVRFAPTQVKAFDDSVRSIGGGASMAYVQVTGTANPTGLQSGQGFSNKGKEFWVGYGATEKMYSDNSQDMRFTFSNSNNVPATVTISIPNKPTFTPITYTVPANGTITTNANEMPETGTNDARLVNEGVYNTGIKIVSDTPVVVYCHAITSQVYAASVLFPTPTLGREYTSLNFKQRSNYSGARSYLFVVATEDNTQLEITLPAGVETDTHAAGSTFTQTLNKGEILNLFGKYIGQPNLHTGNDLSGTVVKSISGIGNCKPFAMYCGSSKITIDCDNGSNGSADNLFQQMFPKQAWGTKVITVPTAPLPFNHFRVLVSDPTTVVKRNGVTLTGLVSGKYYDYFNSTSSIDVLDANKPIMVAQFMSTHDECGNAGSNGDPEMIYLSSVQQTVDTISFVSSPLGNTNGRSHYLNIVIPTSGVASFKLDGATQVASFLPVPFDPTFSYAQFLNIAQSVHTITAPSGFNATAFGIAADESYGYNAGTNVKDLLSGFSIQNQFGTGTASNACTNNEFYTRVTLPYLPTSLVWNFFANPNLVPNATFTQTNPTPIDSFIVNNQKLYVFKNPTPYKYNLVGTIPVQVSATNPVPDGCNGLQVLNFTVSIVAGPTASFNFSNTAGCLTPPVQFTDLSTYNSLIPDLYQWNFGDAGSGLNNTSTLQNPIHAFSTSGTFNVTERVITLEGCYDDSVRTIILSAVPVASYTAPAQGCQGQAVTFTNASSIASGTIAQWNWNFGDATPIVNATTNANQSHTFATPGTYTVTLTVVSTTGCSSTVFSQPIIINALPVVSLSNFAGVCTNTTPFTITNGTPAGGVYSGTGVVGGTTFNPSLSGAGTFTITYTYTTPLGCINATTNTITVTQAFNLAIQPVAPLCIGAANVTLLPSVAGGVFSGNGVSGNIFNPNIAGVGTHTITYAITGNACSIPATIQITVNALPIVSLANFAGTCTNTTPFALTNGTPAGGIYSGTGIVGGTTFNPSLAGPGTFNITYTYATPQGCVSSASKTIVVTQAFNLSIQPVAPICVNAPSITLVPSIAAGVFSGNGVSGTTFNPAIAGIGTHTITYAVPGNACSIPATIQIVVNPKPFVNAGPDLTIVNGFSDFINATGNANTYLWTPPTGLSNTTSLNILANPNTTTSYTLTGTNQFGCTEKDVMVVNVIAPCVDPSKIFTPNGDGFYDKWIVYSDNGCTKNVSVNVYNRWGALVYHADKYTNNWDGTRNGSPLPDATYYYEVRATLIGNHETVIKGNVTIMR